MCRWFIALSILTLVAPAIMAQDAEPAKSTAQVGEKLPGPFPSFAVTGDHAKNVHCFVCQYDLRPTIAVIARSLPEQPTAPLANLFQKMESAAIKHKAAGVAGFGIFLTLDTELLLDVTRLTKIGAIEGFAAQLKLKEIPLGIEYPGAKPVAAYGIGKGDVVTVLVYNRHKIAARFAFTAESPMKEADVDAVIAALDKVLPAKKP